MRSLSLFAWLLPAVLLAQVPQSFEFQGIARDISGNVIPSQAISLRLGIVAGSAGGTIVYQETQAATTSALGLFAVQVGNGTPVLGTFAAVNWTSSARFLKVEMDPAGGTTYQVMGTTQLLSVPYALVAGSIPCFTVSLTGDTLRQGNGCYVIIPGISEPNTPCIDTDGDGYFNHAHCGPIDCNNTNANIHPGAAELCNGIDDDCDGAVDEGDPGGGAICVTGGVGVCQGGHIHCVSGALACVPDVSPSAEVCNGLDDNCNGAVDDGAATSCDDGLACTLDACASGTCTHTVVANTCLISGVCYGSGTVRPGFPCMVCNTSVSTNTWSSVSAGTVCAAASCTGSTLTNASTCNGAGSCVTGATLSCAPYTCNGGGTACLTTCATNSNCASGFYCSGSTCVALKAAGALCSSGSECLSGNCVDGVCCNTACAGTCQACTAVKKGSGADGTCGNIASGADPDNECAGNCNGAGACGP